MGRPCGLQREALLSALDQGPGTTRVLAARAGLQVDDAMRVLDNMVRNGVPQATVLRHERVPGCKRPVPVYARLVECRGDAANDPGVLAAFQQLGMALFGPGVVSDACGMGAAG